MNNYENHPAPKCFRSISITSKYHDIERFHRHVRIFNPSQILLLVWLKFLYYSELIKVLNTRNKRNIKKFQSSGLCAWAIVGVQRSFAFHAEEVTQTINAASSNI